MMTWQWTSYIKQTNRTETLQSSAAGSLKHGPEGCMVAGHLNVRKVPGALRFALHTKGHDHEIHMINVPSHGPPEPCLLLRRL